MTSPSRFRVPLRAVALGFLVAVSLTVFRSNRGGGELLIQLASSELPEITEHPALPGLKLIWCPPGRFLMGSPKSELGRFANEAQTEVSFSKGFFLQHTELTQQQWLALRQTNPSDFKGPENPVENVSWDDARQFCEDLTKKALEDSEIPRGWKFALPTEAQWEYACRAGTQTPLNNGKSITVTAGLAPELDEVAWYEANSSECAHPVAQKKPNAWGFYDMHGNLWEWCSDWFVFRLPGGVAPEGPREGAAKVIRGGSWYIGYPAFCRSAYRSSYGVERRISHLGFRIALVQNEDGP